MEQAQPPSLNSEKAESLQRLRDLAQTWIRESGALSVRIQKKAKEGKVRETVPVPMDGYADFLFAFGLACVGAAQESRTLLAQARATLPVDDLVHAFLADAYSFRVEEALQGKPAAGSLSSALLARIEAMWLGDSYAVNRLRRASSVLEPEDWVDPYAIWSAQSGLFAKPLSELANIRDGALLAERFRSLLNIPVREGRPLTAAERLELLRSGFQLCHRLGPDVIPELLQHLPAALDAVRHQEIGSRMDTLAAAFFAAGAVRCHASISLLLELFGTLLHQDCKVVPLDMLEDVANSSLRTLRHLDARKELEQLLPRWLEVVLAGDSLARLEDLHPIDHAIALRRLLPVAACWIQLGRDQEALPVLDAAVQMLVSGRLEWGYPATLAYAYLGAAAQLPGKELHERLQRFFTQLPAIADNFTTRTRFNCLIIPLLEAAVFAVLDGPAPASVLRRQVRLPRLERSIAVKRWDRRQPREADAK